MSVSRLKIVTSYSPIKYAHYGTKQITHVPTKELLLTCEGDFGKYAID